ncbi:MAG: hypothetical protein MJZ68_07100, partial [archaeon]|nr:hypothetical protein [archaeon]
VRIAVNSVIGCEDLVFLTSSKRYSMMYPEMRDISHKVIATSNISPVGAPFGYTINYGRIRPFGDKVVNDNSLVMLLELLIDLSPETVYLAGFDGFSGDGKDYFDGRMEIREKKDADSFNSDMTKAIRQRGQLMDIVFLTPSRYNDGREGRV